MPPRINTMTSATSSETTPAINIEPTSSAIRCRGVNGGRTTGATPRQPRYIVGGGPPGFGAAGAAWPAPSACGSPRGGLLAIAAGLLQASVQTPPQLHSSIAGRQ